jgi:hypothetical protein
MIQWKKTLPFFGYQVIKFARSWREAKEFIGYYGVWRASQQPDRNSVKDEWAWINFAALHYLKTWLKPQHRVFEFGGGGSTLFFTKRCAFVATVEHDPVWFDILKTKIEASGLHNWAGYSISGDELSNDVGKRSPANPLDYASTSKGFEHLSFKNYATAINNYPPQSFDLVLVDGRARTSCTHESLAYVKTGGLLVIDNAERPHYLAAFKDVFERDFELIMNQHGPLPYTPDFTTTMVLRKK